MPSNDMSTPVEVTPTVQIFQVAEILPPQELPEWEQFQQERLVLEAYRQGYGLVEQPIREVSTRHQDFLGYPWTEVRFRAMGVKLHGC